MGLDGISINQLRIVPEGSSPELNRQTSLTKNDIKIVDGLSQGQRVNPDKEKQHENNNRESEENNSETEEQNNTESEKTVKINLSQTDKYALRVDGNKNSLLIVEKDTNNIVQTINAESLAKLVHYLADSQGSIFNRKL